MERGELITILKQASTELERTNEQLKEMLHNNAASRNNQPEAMGKSGS